MMEAGVIFYPSDYWRIRQRVQDPAQVIALMDALFNYAENGELPQDGDLCPRAADLFGILSPKIDQNKAKWEAKTQRAADAARIRWEREQAKRTKSTDANAYANACANADANAMHNNVTYPNVSYPTVTERKETNGGGGGGTEQDEDTETKERAKNLVRKYCKNLSPVKTRAVLEDLKTHSFEEVEDAMSRAAEANTQEDISPNYWRTFYGTKGKVKATGSDPGYMKRHYTDADFKGIEVDLDAEPGKPNWLDD